MGIADKRPTVAQREAAVGVPELSVERQLECADDPSPRVRRILAARSDLASPVAHRLARDTNRRVRELLAGNPRCPSEVLMLLLDDGTFQVRWNAAQNPSATQHVHLAAVKAVHPDVAEAVGQLGDRLTTGVIEELVRCPWPAARRRLAEVTRSPALLARLAEDASPTVRCTVATSEHIDEALLRELAGDRSAKVRASVALSGRAPVDVIATLARDRSADVRWWTLVNNPHDQDLVRLHAQDPDRLIRDQATHYLQHRSGHE